MGPRAESNVQSPKKKAHFCIMCNHPIARYGYAWPCRHVFCIKCASQMTTCAVCGTTIQTLESIPCEQRLIVSPSTLQAFKSDLEFFQHIRAVRFRLEMLEKAAKDRGGRP